LAISSNVRSFFSSTSVRTCSTPASPSFARSHDPIDDRSVDVGAFSARAIGAPKLPDATPYSLTAAVKYFDAIHVPSAWSMSACALSFA